MKDAIRLLVALLMCGVGVLHFVQPRPFVRIMPPFLPKPLLLVYVSGFFEIVLGLGLLWSHTRWWAAYGLIALFIAVFPANIYMAVKEIQLNPRRPMPVWMMWARLPLQFVFIAVAYWLRSE